MLQEKFLVFRETESLPTSLKYLPADLQPVPNKIVKVLEFKKIESELFVRIKLGNNSLVFSARHFRTVKNHQIRQKLLAVPVPTKQIVKALRAL
jgi:hypothetical protein